MLADCEGADWGMDITSLNEIETSSDPAIARSFNVEAHVVWPYEIFNA